MVSHIPIKLFSISLQSKVNLIDKSEAMIARKGLTWLLHLV
jgi:hypothetical protein